MPAEWEPHAACWLAWPRGEDLWDQYLKDAQTAFVALCQAISDIDQATGEARGEMLRILVQDDADEREARQALGKVPACFHRIPYGDIWLRDTGPLFATRADGA